MDSKAAHWIKSANYDIETAQAMLQTQRYIYVGFMCHQSIEKALKAIIQSITHEIPPKIPGLRMLCDRAGLTDELSARQISIIAQLQPLNI